MQRIGRTLAVAAVTLLTASCSRTDFAVSQHQQTKWASVKGLAMASARPAVPPRILPKTHFAAGRLFEKQGATVRAIDQYRRAVAANHKFVEAYRRLGLLLGKVGRHQQAITSLRHAVNIDPNSAILRNNLGFELMYVESWEDAHRELSHAVGLRPDFARAHINLAMVLCRMERFEEAFASFETVLPESDAYYNLGLMYRGQQRYEEAALAFRRTLEIDGDFVAASKQLEEIDHRLPATPEEEYFVDVAETAPAVVTAPSSTTFVDERVAEESPQPGLEAARVASTPEDAAASDDRLFKSGGQPEVVRQVSVPTDTKTVPETPPVISVARVVESEAALAASTPEGAAASDDRLFESGGQPEVVRQLSLPTDTKTVPEPAPVIAVARVEEPEAETHDAVGDLDALFPQPVDEPWVRALLANVEEVVEPGFKEDASYLYEDESAVTFSVVEELPVATEVSIVSDFAVAAVEQEPLASTSSIDTEATVRLFEEELTAIRSEMACLEQEMAEQRTDDEWLEPVGVEAISDAQLVEQSAGARLPIADQRQDLRMGPPAAVDRTEIVTPPGRKGSRRDQGAFLVRDVWSELMERYSDAPTTTVTSVPPPISDEPMDRIESFGDLEEIVSILEDEARCRAAREVETDPADNPFGPPTYPTLPSFDVILDIVDQQFPILDIVNACYVIPYAQRAVGPIDDAFARGAFSAVGP